MEISEVINSIVDVVIEIRQWECTFSDQEQKVMLMIEVI